ALDGGALGWRNASQLPPAFFESIKALQVGAISLPFRSPNCVHVLKLNDRRASTSSLVVDQTHVRHILLKQSEVVSESEAQRKIENIKERIENGTKFEEMARQYSEDGSASNGGDLGWVNPGDTVPAFEKAMNALGLGEISAPVLTPFGWHIIQVIERRKQDMSKEAARLKARQEIRARKAEEAYNDWIRELRDKAYVELRLEDKL
ncbi:MAG: molecular chaperone SurA, partial [Methylophilales bacterium 16-45-7]